MKGFPLQPIGKGLGVCSKGVLKQPEILTSWDMQAADHFACTIARSNDMR